MPVNVNLSSYKQVVESSDGNSQMTIANGGTAQYVVPSTVGAAGDVLSCGTTPATLEWTGPAYARLRQNAAGSGTANLNNYRPFTFDTADFAVNITCNTGSGTFTVTKAGTYYVSGTMNGDGCDSNFWVFAMKNAEAIDTKHVLFCYDNDSQTDNMMGLSGNCFMELAAGDSVSFYTGTDNGSSISDTIDMNKKNLFHFEIFKI